MVKRTSPNIIITGTPGVGKTTHAQLLAQNCAGELKHLAINQVAKERDCYDGKDEELGSWIVDEDKVCIESSVFLLRRATRDCRGSFFFLFFLLLDC